MNIQGVAGLPDAGGVQKRPSGDPLNVAKTPEGAGVPLPGSASIPPGGAAAATRPDTAPAAQLAQAVANVQKQISAQESSVALTAGLDPGGSHPGQVLVQLKDNVTQQVFVHYYVPAEQVAKAAAQGPTQGVPPGTLLKGKA
ncbi:hypothetical protein [Thiomonas sp. FB-Cd]|uniref:hypothetical protein n=1 Tax=Thiomonas sp. FB-Cd TaxID=1158292 RepID=UPI000AA1ED26|nr:hypothetical protein [Thiomonas sp. FB-Cd]